MLFEDMLWSDEAMRYKPTKPVRNVNHVVVEFLFVHCGHDLAYLCVDGEVVAFSPIQERVIACGRGVEVVRAPDCHDEGVVLNECLSNSVCAEIGNY